MQPLRYITDVASTNTLSPSISKLLSIIPAPFSKCMEYEKPEHPPPTTPMRKPAGTGFCWAMISFTLETALVVRVMGADFLTSGTVVVAIRISLALKLFDYSKIVFPTRAELALEQSYNSFDARARPDVARLTALLRCPEL